MNLLDKITCHPFIEEVVAESILLDDKPKESFTEVDIYVNNCAFYSVHFFSLLDQLENAIHVLSHYRYGIKGDQFGRGKHFSYNYENYLIRLISISDRLLQVVNSVYNLGIDERDVKETLILKNEKVLVTPLPKEFKELKKILNNYNADRNAIIHKNSLINKDIVRIEKMYHPELSKRFFERSSPEEIARFKSLRSRVLSHLVIKTKKDFRNINNDCFEKILPILDTLNIQYAKMKGKLI
jgi:hypothetical protein